MITEINGNLIEMFKQKQFDILLHSCNCFNTMGAGIARIIGDKYPEAEAADSATIRGDINKLGTYECVETADGIIINLYGQYNFGFSYGKTPTSYLALETALKQIAKQFQGKRIGTYQLGCNRGGADWTIVKPIIAKTISHGNTVSIVNYVEPSFA